MEENSDFNVRLTEKLTAFAEDLERKVLPSLKAEFQNFTTIYSTLYNILIKKGVLAEDPYQYDEKISDITPISDQTFSEGEKSTVIGIRLSSFKSQLDFLNEFFIFSLDYFSLQRLKNVTHFIRFIRWEVFAETSQEINTRCLAELVGRVRKGDDAMTNNILGDTLKQLTVYQAKILDRLKRILLYKREEYKLELRKSVLPAAGATVSDFQRDQELPMRKIRKEFPNHMKAYPFVPELVKEVVDEEYSTGSMALREELLTKLTVVEDKKEVTKSKVNFKGLLMDCLKTLSAASVPLEGSLMKLKNNSLVMEDRILTFKEKFLKFLSTMVGGDKKEVLTYTVEMIDQTTSAHRHEDIPFDKFIEDGQSKVKLMNNLAVKNSTLYQSVNARSEDEILEYFERQYLDLFKMTERINALDAFFKTETPKERRSMIKGVKNEIASLRLALSNANKLKHEYVSAREEEEQLKRLGIKT